MLLTFVPAINPFVVYPFPLTFFPELKSTDSVLLNELNDVWQVYIVTCYVHIS